jgi:enamine deaminase RidA (YjgF/YER057c/UK114 family)
LYYQNKWPILIEPYVLPYEVPMTRKPISSGSPYEAQIGFSRAGRAGNLVSVAGTAPISPDSSTVGVGDPAAQTRRCLEIIKAALKEAWESLKDVSRTRIFITRVADRERIGEVHGEFFRDIRPASTMVQVVQFLDPDWLVEIEADAFIDTDAA